MLVKMEFYKERKQKREGLHVSGPRVGEDEAEKIPEGSPERG